MNAVEDGRPITPRTGYVVEINALWYNARLFTAAIQRCLGKEHIADLMEYQAEITKDSFIKTFWNGMYLDDYVALKNSGVLGCTEKKHYLCAHKHETT